ncbi:MAG: hypothetical protein WD512_17490, partial [Candidatus Paceibacterota bacterium]
MFFNIFLYAIKIAASLAIIDVVCSTALVQPWTYNDLKDCAATICWNVLLIYGKIHIFSNNYIVPPIKYYILCPLSNLIQLSSPDKERIVFVKDGNEMLSYTKKSMISYKNVNEYDFILFYPKNKCTMILNNINDIPDTNEVNSDLLNTTVSFMCCQISITLTNDEIIKKFFEINEFCVNSNKILDEPFVNWYCKKHFNNEFDIKDIKTYSLNLLDKDVNDVLLESGDCILINADTYIINRIDVNQPKIENEATVKCEDVSHLPISSNDETLCENDKNELSDEDIEKIVKETLDDETVEEELNDEIVKEALYNEFAK